MTDKTKRIRKMLLAHPDNTDEQLARKIGMSNEAGAARVRLERYLMGRHRTGNIHRNPHIHSGGEDDTHATCVPIPPLAEPGLEPHGE